MPKQKYYFNKLSSFLVKIKFLIDISNPLVLPRMGRHNSRFIEKNHNIFTLNAQVN
jgi:hypothetical protein